VALAALIVSIFSVLVSSGGVVYARLSAASSTRSADAAAVTAALDTDRRHAELTPRFHITCGAWNQGSDKLRLTVQLTGPVQLCALDEITLTIRNDQPWRDYHEPVAGGPTREQIDAQVWGRWRLTPHSVPDRGPGADENGRSSTEPGLSVGEALVYQLEPTQPPPWAHQDVDSWQAQMGSVLRLTLDCTRDGYTRWVLPAELIYDGLGTASTDIPQALT
jgi:hypothetical protein